MGQCIFITGGVRSGKSAFAESYVKKFHKPAAYVATSEAFDEEMKARIQRHQLDRQSQSTEWHLYEMPNELHVHIQQELILFECVTTWLTNSLFLYERPDSIAYFKEWLTIVLQRGKTVIVVSNEVLDAGVTAYEETNEYLQAIGHLHRWLVAICDEAYEMNHQIVKRWK